MRRTYHLVPRAAWAAAHPRQPYAAASLAAEGFIHCTDGQEAMVDTANRHYRSAPGEFVVLTIDLDRCGSPWRIDEPGTPFPHIYGPIARDAVLSVMPFPRAADGTFTDFVGAITGD